jgi:spore coat protein A
MDRNKSRKMLLGLIAFAFLFTGLWAPVYGEILDPTTIPQFVDELFIPPVMPKDGVMFDPKTGKFVNYYEIEVVQFEQQILPTADSSGIPTDLPKTKIWSYGAVGRSETRTYPAWTVENLENLPTRVKWVNSLVDDDGNFLPHFLPIDQTLHWANPPQDCIEDMHSMDMDMVTLRTDCRGQNPEPYMGPVPIILHLHGAHVGPESDGYPEAWFLPAAKDIPGGYAIQGSNFDQYDPTNTDPGTVVFQYPNDQRETALWYHDHTLGMTRVNVYAWPAGFYMIRDVKNLLLGLPGPAPLPGVDPNNPTARRLVREIPLVIQDKSFNEDGSLLFYPDNRAFFEGLEPDQLQIPFIPEPSLGGQSDVSPIWNPEFFGNTMVVNGKTWPKFEVEKRRYRFRILNACDSRFLILKNSNDLKFWQIGADGGFLPDPVELETLLLGPAERADVIIDFSDEPVGSTVILENLGPDEPFGGGVPGEDFDAADPDTTGKVMQFVVKNRVGFDLSKRPDKLNLPQRTPLGKAKKTRKLSLNEDESETVFVSEADGNLVEDVNGDPFGPTSARLGILDGNGFPVPIPPEVWETGTKDTVIVYPGMLTRVKAKFDTAGLYVWHCHILSHEDNEMMRAYRVGPGSLEP